MADEGLVELAQTADPQLDIRRPGGVIKGMAGGGDGLIHVVRPAVGRNTKDLLRGRVDRLEDGARSGCSQLAIDEEALFA